MGNCALFGGGAGKKGGKNSRAVLNSNSQELEQLDVDTLVTAGIEEAQLGFV